MLLQQSANILGLVNHQGDLSGNPDIINGLDLNEDFVSDASSEDEGRMKKAQYEMDQIVTDALFKDDRLKMGLSLFYTQ